MIVWGDWCENQRAMIDWQEAYSGLLSLCNKKDAEIERLRAASKAMRKHKDDEIERLRAMNDDLGKANQWQRVENDRLIARNAELLAALKRIAANGLVDEWTRDIARAAIEKAEGHE